MLLFFVTVDHVISNSPVKTSTSSPFAAPSLRQSWVSKEDEVEVTKDVASVGNDSGVEEVGEPEVEE